MTDSDKKNNNLDSLTKSMEKKLRKIIINPELSLSRHQMVYLMHQKHTNLQIRFS